MDVRRAYACGIRRTRGVPRNASTWGGAAIGRWPIRLRTALLCLRHTARLTPAICDTRRSFEYCDRPKFLNIEHCNIHLLCKSVFCNIHLRLQWLVTHGGCNARLDGIS